MYRNIISIYTALVLSFHFSIYPDELHSVEDTIRFVEGNKRFILNLVEGFEGDVPWKEDRAEGHIARIEFSKKTPDLPSYRKETEFYKTYSHQVSEGSLFYHSSIEIPGKESKILVPKSIRALPSGLPIRVFLWAKSNNLDITIHVIFEDFDKKEISTELGRLDFSGWRRLEGSIPVKAIRLNEKKFYTLKGILLKSAPKQKKGVFSLQLDQLSVLIDTLPLDYPGSEIQDGWKLK
jgi:hypothetical protein